MNSERGSAQRSVPDAPPTVPIFNPTTGASVAEVARFVTVSTTTGRRGPSLLHQRQGDHRTASQNTCSWVDSGPGEGACVSLEPCAWRCSSVVDHCTASLMKPFPDEGIRGMAGAHTYVPIPSSHLFAPLHYFPDIIRKPTRHEKSPKPDGPWAPARPVERGPNRYTVETGPEPGRCCQQVRSRQPRTPYPLPNPRARHVVPPEDLVLGMSWWRQRRSRSQLTQASFDGRPSWTPNIAPGCLNGPCDWVRHCTPQFPCTFHPHSRYHMSWCRARVWNSLWALLPTPPVNPTPGNSHKGCEGGGGGGSGFVGVHARKDSDIP